MVGCNVRPAINLESALVKSRKISMIELTQLPHSAQLCRSLFLQRLGGRQVRVAHGVKDGDRAADAAVHACDRRGCQLVYWGLVEDGLGSTLDWELAIFRL